MFNSLLRVLCRSQRLKEIEIRSSFLCSFLRINSQRALQSRCHSVASFCKIIFHFLLLLSVCGFCFSLRREWERPLRFLLSFGDTRACSLAITYVYAFGLLSCHCRRWQFMLLQKLYVVRRSSLGNPCTMWNLNICSSYARIARSCVLSPFHNI